jgi:hypothetical protein
MSVFDLTRLAAGLFLSSTESSTAKEDRLFLILLGFLLAQLVILIVVAAMRRKRKKEEAAKASAPAPAPAPSPAPRYTPASGTAKASKPEPAPATPGLVGDLAKKYKVPPVAVPIPEPVTDRRGPGDVKSIDEHYAAAHGQWKCPFCETLNDGDKSVCIACGSPRG